MGKLTGRINPANQGMQFNGRNGALNVYPDPQVPKDELWLVDAAGTVIKVVDLWGQTGTSAQGARGTDGNSNKRR